RCNRVAVRARDFEAEVVGVVGGDPGEGVAVLGHLKPPGGMSFVGRFRCVACWFLFCRARGGPGRATGAQGGGEDDREPGAVEAQPGRGVHEALTSSYPASSTAPLIFASSSGPSLTTVSRPLSRSTSTEVTPATSPTSSLTELTQCPQVMPLTV